MITALPIPQPPRWTARFRAISALLTCDLMLHLLYTVLARVVNKRCRVRAESHAERALHLITLGLHEDKLEYEAGNRNLSFVLALQSELTDSLL